MIYPPSQKPPIWSIDPGVIAYNCQRAGMPHPVLAMPFWEGAGNRALDYSGHGNHSANSNITWTGSEKGTCLNFVDGYGQIISDNLPLIGSDATFSALIKNVGVVSYDGIIGNGLSSGGWAFMLSAGKPHIFIDTSGHTANTAVSTTGFSHVIITYVNSTKTINFYLNGDPDGTAISTSNITDNGNTFYIGADGRDGSGYWYSGLINNIHVFNVALTAPQVKFISDNPYFMYQIPEELYGYVAAAPPVGAIMNQFQKFNVGADLYNGAIIA